MLPSYMKHFGLQIKINFHIHRFIVSILCIRLIEVPIMKYLPNNHISKDLKRKL